MSRIRSCAALAAVLATFALTACGSDSPTAPEGATIPAADLEAASTEVAVIATDPTLMALLGPSGFGAGTLTGSPALARTGAVGALLSRTLGAADRGMRLAASGVRGIRVPDAPALSVGLTVPVDFRGKVYALDATETYVATGEAGPAAGMRMLLYPYDPNGAAGNRYGANAIGYAEVTDAGSTNVDRLDVKVYANGVATPLLSYRIIDATLSQTAFRDTIIAAIALTNGKTMAYQYAGEITGYQTAAERWFEDYEASVPSVQLELTQHIVWEGWQVGDVQTFTAAVKGKAVKLEDPIRQQGTAAPYQSDTMTVKVDDRLAGYVVFSQTIETVRPNGSAMAPADRAAILRMFDAAQSLVDLFGVFWIFSFWSVALGVTA